MFRKQVFQEEWDTCCTRPCTYDAVIFSHKSYVDQTFTRQSTLIKFAVSHVFVCYFFSRCTQTIGFAVIPNDNLNAADVPAMPAESDLADDQDALMDSTVTTQDFLPILKFRFI